MNLDCLDIDELSEYINHTSPGICRQYAIEKRRAMRARLSGDINKAIRHERNCDILYSDISDPSWQKLVGAESKDPLGNTMETRQICSRCLAIWEEPKGCPICGKTNPITEERECVGQEWCGLVNHNHTKQSTINKDKS